MRFLLNLSVALTSGSGAALPYQANVFPDREHFGRIFYNMVGFIYLASRMILPEIRFNPCVCFPAQAQMSALGIPQLASIHGISVAGMSRLCRSTARN